MSDKAKGWGWRVPLVLVLLVGLGGAAARESALPAARAGGACSSGDVAWMLTAACLVLLMTPGLSFFYGGMVQRKNVVSTLLQSFICMGVVSVLWVVVGFSLAFGDSYHGVIGNPATFFMFRGVGGSTDAILSPTIPLALYAMFQLKFAIITPALITGAFAERVRFSSYLLFICLFSLFIYAPLAHWTWHPDGFLHRLGVLDFAGGSVVHMSAGFAALASAWLMGRRRVVVTGQPTAPGHIPYVLLGMGMLWFGWFGFNAGSALAANDVAVLAFVTTNTASAAAMLGWVFFDVARGRKPTAIGAAVGAVVGLVAITPAAGYVSVGASLFIGVIAAIISNLAVHWKSKISNLDDTLDVFPCHGLGGIVGMICTALFARAGGLFTTGQGALFFHHIEGLVIVSVFTFFGSAAIYRFTDWVLPMRVPARDESQGLDLSQHGETLG